MVDRSTLAHFRAHTSPLLLLQFDASGTLLVTASVHGHTVNIYHLAAPSRKGEVGSAVHLFRLCRGVTPAVIQGVAFSRSGRWLCVSSARVREIRRYTITYTLDSLVRIQWEACRNLFGAYLGTCYLQHEEVLYKYARPNHVPDMICGMASLIT